MSDLWLDLLRNESRLFIVFPHRTYSAAKAEPENILDRDPEGQVPAYQGEYFGGALGTFMLRDHKFAIVPSTSVETFGKGKEVRVVYSPVIPADNLETLESLFGGTVRIAKLVSFLGKKAETWFSLINILQGENTARYMSAMEEARLEAISQVKNRELIESGEKELIQSLRATRSDMTKSPLSKFYERIRRATK